mgnify:CR=1 FL=1
MRICFKHAQVWKDGSLRPADVLVSDGRIVSIGDRVSCSTDTVCIEVHNAVIFPGFVDVHVHLREPGFEHKEDIESGTRAAVKGGFTSVCAMPNTDPCIDDAVGVEYVKAVAEKKGHCKVEVSGACTHERQGETLSDMGDMFEHGVRMFTDDGAGIQKAGSCALSWIMPLNSTV